MKVRFLVDKEQRRGVFAEAGSDFVDILFSYLTLPLGSIVKLLNKQSGLGSLDNLYQSVEQLDAKYLQTEACKEMLLNPRSVAAKQCEELKIKNIHDPNPRTFYTCTEKGCLVQSTCYYTYTSKCLCSRCGKVMDKSWSWQKKVSDEGAVFVNDSVDFIITDDLRVIQSSLKGGFSILKELQIEDERILEERVIDFGTEEALALLRRSLMSKNALTWVCFPDTCVHRHADCSSLIKNEMVVDDSKSEITLDAVIYMENNKVLYAEVEEDFVNQLFSFLTFPLGSVLGLLPENLLLSGCVKNLHLSAKNMSSNCFKSKCCRNFVIPKICSFYGIEDQMIGLQEITSEVTATQGSCANCFIDNGYKSFTSSPCRHGISKFELIEQNPKLIKGVDDSDDVFVTGPRKFMVSDKLHISPLSFISAIGDGMKIPTSKLVIKEVSIGIHKAQSLLNTMLISKTVLTDIFSPKSSKLPTKGKSNSI